MSVLKERHPDLEPEVCTSYDGLAAAIAEVQPSVVYSSRFLPGAFPSRALMEAPCVRWVSNAGSGINHLIPWDPGQVTVTNSAGVAAEAMAQFAFGAMLHFSLDVPGLLHDQSNRAWANRSIVPLSGKRLLLVGFGKTCQAAARLGKAMGMDVCAIRANPQAVDDLCEVGPPQDLAHQMTIADFILVCLPLTDRTIGLVGAEALAKVKKGAVLVDLSRGGIVDHDAMVDALDDRRIGGAALDVFPIEPLSAVGSSRCADLAALLRRL
ncbi:MAG: NAD(P)-dependent oxidoreductase [Pseudomonadota bacterium]